MEYVVFTSEEAQRTQRAVEHYEQHVRRTLPPLKRPFRDISGGGGCVCKEIHKFYTGNAPTSGSAVVTYSIGASTYDVTFDWDATRLDIISEFATHVAEFGDVSVYGGEFPEKSIVVVWADPPDDIKGIANWPDIDNSGLTGGILQFDKAQWL